MYISKVHALLENLLAQVLARKKAMHLEQDLVILKASLMGLGLVVRMAGLLVPK
jgi:hypothetical protein